MIKENQKLLNNIHILLDMSITLLSFVFAYYTKFYILKGINSIGTKGYVVTAICSTVMYFIIYNTLNLYNTKRISSIYTEIKEVITSNIIGALILILVLFIVKLINYSRVVLLLFMIYNTILTSLVRIIIRYILRKSRLKGFNQKHCLIVGTTKASKTLVSKIKKNGQWGYNILGCLNEKDNKKDEFEGMSILGDIGDIENILDKMYIDIVFITIDSEYSFRLGEIINKCEKAGVKTNIIPYYYNYVPTKPYIDDLDGLPIIDIRHVPLDNYFKNSCKRLFDICFSLFAILITLPIMLFSIIMIKITSPGPMIYKQIRVGLNRKDFYMYKFRSMKVQDDEDEKTKWTTKMTQEKQSGVQ